MVLSYAYMSSSVSFIPRGGLDLERAWKPGKRMDINVLLASTVASMNTSYYA